MRVSSRADYGVRALFDLALHYGQGPVQSRDIAGRQGVPEAYLHQVLGAWGAEPRGAEAEAGAGSGPPAELGFRPLADGERVGTDAGDLVAVSTPGHAREHLVFHWPDEGAVFVGDLVLGSGDTTWVGGYPGCVGDYLASLDRVEALAPRLLLPAHGPPVTDPAAHLERFRAHRLDRIAQVRRALAVRPDASLDELLRVVYGHAVPTGVLPAARASLAALIEHARESPR